MEPSERPEPWTLFDAACSGVLTEVQTGELRRMLLTSRAARSDYLQYCAMHTDLCFQIRARQAEHALAYRVAADAAPARRGGEGASATPAVYGWLRRSMASLSQPGRFGLFVASVTIMSLLLTTAQIPWQRHVVDSSDVDSPIEAAPVFARWNAVGDCRWSDSEVPRAELRANDQFDLASGVAEIQFGHGARLLLHGPCRLQILAKTKVRLAQGVVLAQIAETARGFAVLTPQAEVVDLGTEFSIEVTPRGETNVQVLLGLVELRVPARDQPPALTLAAGQGGRADAMGLNRVEHGGRFAELQSALQRAARSSAKGGGVRIIFQNGKELSPLAGGGVYHGCQDVRLVKDRADQNFGSRWTFAADHQTMRSLLRFDLRGLAGAQGRIQRAGLRLHWAWGTPKRGAGKLQLCRVAPANAAWVQGSQGSIRHPAENADGATWNFLHPAPTFQPWAGAAGCSLPGVDYFEPPLAEAAYDAIQHPLQFDFVWDQDLEFLREWIERPETNAGFLVQFAPQSWGRVDFQASETKQREYAPEFWIEWEPASLNPVTASTVDEYP